MLHIRPGDDILPPVELIVEITDTGRAVLDDEADWIKLNSIDRWLGGVHLQGEEAAWRWDEQQRRMVALF
jgi:hypothetical protein